jgi:hypothetical protein
MQFLATKEKSYFLFNKTKRWDRYWGIGNVILILNLAHGRDLIQNNAIFSLLVEEKPFWLHLELYFKA